MQYIFASIYLCLQTDGEFFIRSSMFAYRKKKKKTLEFVNYYPNQNEHKKKKKAIHLFLLTTISFKASFDSTFSQIQITQEIVKPENVFTRLSYTRVIQHKLIQIRLKLQIPI